MGLKASSTNRPASPLAGAAASTPGPWSVRKRRNFLGDCIIDGAAISAVAIAVDPIDAELIVRAVNAHDALVAALNALLEFHNEGRLPDSETLTQAELALDAAVGDRTAPAKTETGA